ncbi:Mrp/NBP35 family ATP-binding protein [Stomatohabitans albus]|uniref:Mrp/NBP35 family ATP-binding protein n=1 Tax=Stomatohabitans albus TaxID=3110766 RepID=UPI00300C5E0B
MSTTPAPNVDQIYEVLSTVMDPEIGMPITDLGMVQDVELQDGEVTVHVLLTVAGCPMKDRINRDISQAVQQVEGITALRVGMSAMNDEQRTKVGELIREKRGINQSRQGNLGGGNEAQVPFAQADSPTHVIAIASGKGGVGKSSVTANLAVALAKQGAKVGVLDADVWGYSIPRMLGVTGQPVQFEGMVMPLLGHDVKVMSIGFFTDPDKPVVWRGPMLHRALQQFLTDVHWGDLDVLLIDLPPGTGDIALSMAQLIPNADMLVVTTPQAAAQKVAQRAGIITKDTGMNVIGVIENMATFVAPDTGVEYDIFGSGGGEALAEFLDTELWASLPIDPRLREGGDAGTPITLAEPDSLAATRFMEIAMRLRAKKKSIVGGQLPLA